MGFQTDRLDPAPVRLPQRPPCRREPDMPPGRQPVEVCAGMRAYPHAGTVRRAWHPRKRGTEARYANAPSPTLPSVRVPPSMERRALLPSSLTLRVLSQPNSLLGAASRTVGLDLCGFVREVAGQRATNYGGGGIRTPETLASLTVFKTVAFSHSATPPSRKLGNTFEFGRPRGLKPAARRFKLP